MDLGSDFGKGKILVYESLLAPMKQILINAGSLDVDNLIEVIAINDDNVGFNVKLGCKVEDLMKSGIIDSTKALRCALVNAASVAGSAITSEAIIVTVS